MTALSECVLLVAMLLLWVAVSDAWIAPRLTDIRRVASYQRCGETGSRLFAKISVRPVDMSHFPWLTSNTPPPPATTPAISPAPEPVTMTESPPVVDKAGFRHRKRRGTWRAVKAPVSLTAATREVAKAMLAVLAVSDATTVHVASAISTSSLSVVSRRWGAPVSVAVGIAVLSLLLWTLASRHSAVNSPPVPAASTMAATAITSATLSAPHTIPKQTFTSPTTPPVTPIDFTEEALIEERSQAVEKVLLRKHRNWRIQHDASLNVERGDLLLNDDDEGSGSDSRASLEVPIDIHAESMELDRVKLSTPSAAKRSMHIAVVDAPAESMLSTDPSLSSADLSHPPSQPVQREGSSSASAPKTNKMSSFLRNLFSKEHSGRPIDMAMAFVSHAHGDEKPSQLMPWKRLVADELFASLSLQTQDDEQSRLQRPTDATAELVDCWSLDDFLRRHKSSLESHAAADAFADIVNVFAVRLVDRAADWAHREEDLARCLSALDELSLFMECVEELFVSLFPDGDTAQSIAPIVYNGQTKKAALEKLFTHYLRASSSANPLAMVFQLATSSASESLPPQCAATPERVDRLQSLLDISKEKRQAAERKQSREMMWSMAKQLVSGKKGASGMDGSPASMLGRVLGQQGAGGMPMPDLSALESMFGGKSNGGNLSGLPNDLASMFPKDMPMPDMSQLQEMMKSMGMGGSGAEGGRGMPDLSSLQSLMKNIPTDVRNKMPNTMFDMQSLQQMLNSSDSAGGLQEKLKEMQQSLGIGDDPQSMQRAAAESMSRVRDALSRGEISSAEVRRVEEMLGVNLSQLVDGLGDTQSEDARSLFQQLSNMSDQQS